MKGIDMIIKLLKLVSTIKSNSINKLIGRCSPRQKRTNVLRVFINIMI